MTSPVPLSLDLLAWFGENQREMPWRRTHNAYAIWVSEIMLQQTQVATVIPYFNRFMGRFPTPEALATAPEGDVLKLWEGLGYYSRARNLQAGAQMVMNHHGGLVPETWDEVRRLPGVGDYTAGAILSIAFGQAVPAVDGNVMRVLSRINMVLDDISKPATRKQFDRLARDLLPGVNPGQLNQALMELGATVCTPAKPRCETCPVQHHCRAFAAGVAASLPVKPKKQAVRAITLATVIVVRGDRLLIVRRPTDGIWGGLWAFPSVELAPTADLNEQQSALASALAAVGIEATIGAQVQSRRHTLTHRQLEIPVYRAHHTMGEPDPTIGAWVTPAQAREYALPVPFQLMVAALDPGPLFLAAEREQGEYNSKPTLTGGSPPNGS